MTALALPQVRSRATARIAAFVFVGIAGLALRIWVDRAAVGIPDSDEAVMGLMVRHATHGEIGTFFWGQGYGGTQEVLLTVPLFLAFGASYTALRAVPIVLSALASLLLWRVGRRTIGEPGAAIGAALLWIWFPENLVRVTKQLGFYGSNLVYAALILLLVLRVVERPTRLRAALLGLALGLGFWQTVQIVPVAAPAVAWAIWKQPRALRQLWVAAPAAVLGALPWLVWNIRNDWGSFMPRADAHQYAHSIRLFLSPLLPMTIGLRTPVTGALLVPSKVLVTLAYLALLVLCAYGAYASRRREVSLLYTVAFAFPFIWALSRRVSFLSATPRFLIVLTPVIALLVAQLGRRLPAAIALAAAALAISAVSIQRMDDDAKAFHPHGIPVVPRDLRGLVGILDRARISYVYADYWIAYRLDFDSHERLVATELDPDHSRIRNGAVQRRDAEARSAAYAREVDASRRHAFVFFRRSTGLGLPRQLAELGYRRVLTGEFAVYLPSLTR